MENRAQKMLQHLKLFYDRPVNIEKFIHVTQNSNKEDVSLRLIDWLVTNYAKEKNVNYKVNSKAFNMHQMYKDMLKAYSKKLFDPFKRHDRITLHTNDGLMYETTVAQLTFFKWAFENKVVEYANLNKEKIKLHMDTRTFHRKLIQPMAHNDKKRKQLSKSTHIKKISNSNILVSFT